MTTREWVWAGGAELNARAVAPIWETSTNNGSTKCSTNDPHHGRRFVNNETMDYLDFQHLVDRH